MLAASSFEMGTASPLSLLSGPVHHLLGLPVAKRKKKGVKLDIWRMIAGLGLFLFAMNQLETALRSFAGRGFRQWLQNATSRPLKSVFVGTAATAFLQSSSLVSLMVLAFVASGLMALENALGVIFGANLGTTLTGWMVTGLGFKLPLDEFALPLVGVGTLSFVMLRARFSELGRLVAALGFLVMGLALMKESVAEIAETVDVARFAGMDPWQFLIFGTLLAAVIQSSSATMMITLAALDGGVISLSSAAAMAIGADLGTTSTVLLGAVKGNPPKKRVALAHFIFNLTTDTLAFAFRVPLLATIAAVGVKDPLFALVAFHSVFNLLGIALFLPFLGLFAKLLAKFFKTKARKESLFVNDSTAKVSEAAVANISEETAHLISRTIRLNMGVFNPPLPIPPGRIPVPFAEPQDLPKRTSFDDLYRQTKRLEGEILSFGLRVQTEPLEAADNERLHQLMGSVREAVHSAKSLRDIRHDLQEFEDSPRRVMNSYLDHFRSIMTSFYGSLFRIGSVESLPPTFEEFAELLKEAHRLHDQIHKDVHADVGARRIGEEEISSLLNVNRELLNSNLALVMALKEFHLERQAAETISQIPGLT